MTAIEIAAIRRNKMAAFVELPRFFALKTVVNLERYKIDQEVIDIRSYHREAEVERQMYQSTMISPKAMPKKMVPRKRVTEMSRSEGLPPVSEACTCRENPYAFPKTTTEKLLREKSHLYKREPGEIAFERSRRFPLNTLFQNQPKEKGE